jgi:hypothetical protein
MLIDDRGWYLCWLVVDTGHISDVLLDVSVWQVRCLSVKTANWWPSALVLIPTGLIQSIDWQSQIVNLRIDQAFGQQARSASRRALSMGHLLKPC